MSAFGSLGQEDLPFYAAGAGLRTEFGTFIPPGGRVYYVRSTTVQNGETEDIAARTIPTLNAALGQCRANAGDTVFVLPGHVESIATADAMSNLVAGVNVVGLGRGNLRPTFTWTAAASTFLLDVANVSLGNLILNMDPGAGTVNVAAPMTVSAPGCSVLGCKIRMGTDANSKVTIGLTTTAGAPDFVLGGNDVYGATAAECTTMMQFVGANRLRFWRNSVVGATSAANVGVVRFLTTASTFIKMSHNEIRNNKAASSVVVTGMAGISGEVDNLFMTGLSDTGLATFFATPADVTFGANVYVANTIGERAALFGTVSA